MGFWEQGSGSRVQGSGCRVQGSGFRVQGSGFRVLGVRALRREVGEREIDRFFCVAVCELVRDQFAADRPNLARIYDEFVPKCYNFAPGCFKRA